jgi:hypothetical protein
MATRSSTWRASPRRSTAMFGVRREVCLESRNRVDQTQNDVRHKANRAQLTCSMKETVRVLRRPFSDSQTRDQVLASAEMTATKTTMMMPKLVLQAVSLRGDTFYAGLAARVIWLPFKRL